jgi:glucose-6-phosphate dehydrogenase assembly protein OpcA
MRRLRLTSVTLRESKWPLCERLGIALDASGSKHVEEVQLVEEKLQSVEQELLFERLQHTNETRSLLQRVEHNRREEQDRHEEVSHFCVPIACTAFRIGP